MIETEFHPENFFITPMLLVSSGPCPEPDCAQQHWMISLGWLVWSIHFTF